MAKLRRCNLCLKRRDMTEDHIFPKAISTPGQRQAKEILKRIGPEKLGKTKSKLVQNGLTKSTLCGSCNNTLLGSSLDPALIHLCKEVSLQLRNAKFLMRPTIRVSDIELNKVARAVAGHFIANDDHPQHKHLLVKALRRYILDPEAQFPKEYKFQLWLYPFKEQAVMKDLYHAQLGTGLDPFGISAYKTYPLAFAFNDEIKNPNYHMSGSLDITDHLSGELKKTFTIHINTKPIVDRNWPYAPIQDGVILSATNESVTTTPYMNIKPYPY